MCYKVFFVIILFVLTSCQVSTQFNSEKWKQESDGFYPYRIGMVEDILSKKLLTGKSELEMDAMLGKSYFIDSLSQETIKYSYQIQVAYGWDIDPKYHSNLVLTLDKMTRKISGVEFVESADRRTWLEKLTSSKY